MKKQDLIPLLRLLGAPIGLILAGVILALAPDVLTTLISRFLGWGILLIGIGFGISAVFGSRGLVGKILGAMCAFAIGGFFIRNPLFIARQIGGLLGLMLLLQGGRETWLSNGRGRPLGIATMVVGLVLLLCPMSFSRIVFSLCGVAMAVVGIVMLLDRLKNRSYLEDGGDPNIIDAL